jgi:pimeloyl-ACP methyl ester carboxylesterase
VSTYVLIHGGMHGGWCWYKLVAALERRGHTVIAPDLPGNGHDKTPLAEVTLKTCTDSVCEILDAQKEPVILVGHSMGGATITQVAEYRPDRIRQLVYVSAVLPRNGEPMLMLMQQDTASAALGNIAVAADGNSLTIRESGVREAFYGDCSDEDIALARLSLCPQPLLPANTPVSTSAENFGRVPRVYIECLRDQAISPAMQKKMYTATPCQKIISMNTCHSPFLSAPEELAAHLASL